MRRVLDASALLSGASFDGDLFTTPEAVAEVRRQGSTPQLDATLALKVQVLTPPKEALGAVDSVARETGDIARLSPTDRGLLALARSLAATLVTDDYSIQNVASRMAIRYETIVERGIRVVVHWRHRCTGSGKFFEEPITECPICGSSVRTTRARAREESTSRSSRADSTRRHGPR